jgi:hypothetical protein
VTLLDAVSSGDGVALNIVFVVPVSSCSKLPDGTNNHDRLRQGLDLSQELSDVQASAPAVQRSRTLGMQRPDRVLDRAPGVLRIGRDRVGAPE